MKKSILLILPAIFLLSGCKEVSFGYTDDQHEKGWDYSNPSSTQLGKVDSYSFRANDTLDNAGLTQVNMTFANINKSETNIQDAEKIKGYVNIDQDIFESASNMLYFSTKEEGYAFIGADSTYTAGEITFNFTQQIKNIEIIAKQYSYTQISFEETFHVDKDVAVSVNDLGFIKVDGEVNEENKTVASTTCAFHLANPSSSINIKVGQYRAVIEKIVLYY